MNSPLVRLKNRVLKLAILICKIRSNGYCELCKIKGEFRKGMEVDHCFSRTIGRLLFDIRNLVHLCNPCHAEKTVVQLASAPAEKQTGKAREIHELVRDREGRRWYNSAVREAMRNAPANWTFHELEKIEAEYKAKVKEANEQ